MANAVITRRLKSVRERQEIDRVKAAEARMRKAAREAQLVADVKEAAGHGISVGMLRATRAHPRVLPMAAYYTRDAAFEAQRARFYADVAKVFGSEGWIFKAAQVGTVMEAGYGGTGRTLLPIDDEIKVMINVTSAPFEWLTARGMLETKLDGEKAGLVRYTAALRYRAAMEGAGVGLKAQGYMGTSGVGGGGRSIADYRLDCMQSVGLLQAMPERLYTLLEAVVWNDEWVWRVRLKKKPSRLDRKELLAAVRKRSEQIILDLHQALDWVARSYGLISPEDFDRRWRRKRGRG